MYRVRVRVRVRYQLEADKERAAQLVPHSLCKQWTVWRISAVARSMHHSWCDCSHLLVIVVSAGWLPVCGSSFCVMLSTCVARRLA